ncbi:LysR family transcriptional regulator [Ensifer sp. SSB1]|jgi:DNA-binding transcriptional LysR family regulator|uniref:LysR family transcriptional regulator n=1 Tax=Ensifer sp. SSB1 TaxID=2795385 RepID=UPI001A4F8929|nr:LysR family transcriptional regulator [Ensifer sp. SSB1]MBK5569098.1 LysR family transcriptional regulator [Ensifer sp. SSB1]
MNSHHRIDWEDLRFVLAVAEANSLAAAARALGVNHTTVLRRVGSFEQRLGVRLFDRLPSGYTLTAGGEELLAVARRMAETVTELERRLTGQDLRLEGSLRITTTDTLMASILPSILAAFRQRHPGVLLEVSTSNALANLSHRDADVAIRPAVDSPDALVGRRIANVAFAVYAAPSYLQERGLGSSDKIDFAGERWIGLGDALASTSVSRWMRATLSAPAVLRCDSLVTAREAAAAGIGLTALPCYLGDTTPGLVRIGSPVAAMTRELWLLTHEDLRRTARVSAFTEFAGQALAKHRPLFEGRDPSARPLSENAAGT